MSDQPTESRNIKEPSYVDAIVPLVTLIVLIAGSVSLFGSAAVDGPMQVALILSVMVTSFIILKNGHSWESIVKSSQSALSSLASPILILLSVGALIGAWNMSGTIPTLVFYGIQLLRPSYFYLATAVICGVISLGTGSSWTTAGTIGVGLVGIASLVGVSPAITAGAIISGAYVGDKISSLSETTILAAQLAEVDVHTHIRAAMWTSGPAFIVALVVFAILGLLETGVTGGAHLAVDLAQLDQIFWITPLNLIPLIFLLILSLRKAPASLAVMGSALLAGVMAAALQPQTVLRFVNDPALSTPLAYIKGIWLALATGYRSQSGVPEVDQLLSRGGMASMLKTLWIIIGAVTFGTLLDEFNLLAKLTLPMLARAKTTGRSDCNGSRHGDWAEHHRRRSIHRDCSAGAPVSRGVPEAGAESAEPVTSVCGCGNSDLAPRAVELVRRIHGGNTRGTHHALSAVLHLQYCIPAHFAIVGVHRFQDRAYPARRGSGRTITN